MGTVINLHSQQSGNIFTRYLERVAENKLPRRFKRLIYVSSILGLIHQAQTPDETLVQKLNEVIQLARYPEAFMFPIYIKSLIWKNIPGGNIQLCNKKICVTDIDECELSTADCNVIGVYFATHAPSWLRYGSQELMAQDVSVLITQLKNLKSA